MFLSLVRSPLRFLSGLLSSVILCEEVELWNVQLALNNEV